MIIDILLLLVWLGVTWCVASDGAFNAGITCIIVVVSGLLAMNFFETVAKAGQSILTSITWQYRWDIVALLGLFIFFVVVLRYALEWVAPLYHQLEGRANEIGRWGFGLITGYVMTAFLLTALHTAPFPREFIDFKPERSNFFDALAPDRQWLGFTQYVSETIFATGTTPNIFDGPVADFIEQEGATTVWPSFPIRYATRRQVFAEGSFNLPSQRQQQAAPQPVNNPNSGAGSAGF